MILVRNSLVDTSTKDDKLDKVFWFKFFFSVAVGIAFGVLNFTGFISFVIYFFVSVMLSFVYFNKFVTNEDIDYQSEVFIEGLNVSVPSFLLCWILSYTLNKSFTGGVDGLQEF